MSDLETYELLQTDPWLWLTEAEGLLLCAGLIWDKWEATVDSKPMAEIFEELIAYTHSIMLLTAYAFENVYRGGLVANKRDWREALRDKGGHAVLKHISEITPLSVIERDLIERLECHLLWVGRYPVPKAPSDYIKAVKEQCRVIRRSDRSLTSALFQRIAAKLKADATKGDAVE